MLRQCVTDYSSEDAGRAQGSSVVTKIGIVLQKPTIIPDVIGSALTTSSNFFINYVAIQVSAPPGFAEGLGADHQQQLLHQLCGHPGERPSRVCRGSRR